jgi:hydroxymethylpyrimidine pyrophosphatase-like HAD family hydrolase
MYCRVLACDFDGTGAVNGRLAPEVTSVLTAARSVGFVILLVTGRVLEELQTAGVNFDIFDAVVAENGALVWLPAAGRTIQLGTPPPGQFLGELRKMRIPYQAGTVIVGTSDRHAGEVLGLIRRSGLASQLVFNRDAMMILPSGVDKAVGALRALDELRRSERSMIAFGDAENDRSLMQIAELSVAPRGAVPSIAAAADERLSHPGPSGVAAYIQGVLEHGGCIPTPSGHRIVIGHDPTGASVGLPSSGMNIMISGDPRSGKSCLAGLVAERLMERGYRVCLVDPEGDYATLGERPRTLLFGTSIPLPDPAALPNVLREESLNLIVSLASLSQREKVRYVERILPGLEATRAVTGVPHWIMLDEAHYFLNERATSSERFESRTGNWALVTYRPSLIAATVHEAIGAHLVTRTTVEEERYFVSGLLQARGPNDLVVADALGGIQLYRAGLLLQGKERARWQIFTPDARTSLHVHHARKYADTLLPEEKSFRFLHADGICAVAHSVGEFCAAIEAIPMASLHHHLLAGDFSRWAVDTLGDAKLAARFRKLEDTTRVGAAPSREEITTHLRELYLT